MFGLFRKSPEVDCIDCKDGQVTFRSGEMPAVGRSQKVQLKSADQKPVAVKVSVTAARPLDDGSYVCTAVMESPVESLAPIELRRPAVRQQPRRECSMRVRGLEVPGYVCRAVDFSAGGMQLQAGGPVNVGQVIDLEIDHPSGGAALPCTARVAWSSGSIDRGFFMGVEFHQVDRQALSGFVSP